MPLSTSSSNPRSANGAIALLLASLLVWLVVVESGARLLVNPASKVQRRVEGERVAALALRRGAAQRQRTLLLVGNSLLLEGVDVPDLVRMTQHRWLIQRFVVENTSYLDWHFGLRRLFEEGSHPDVALLMLSPGNFSASTTRGDYFARYLMRTNDLPAVMQTAQLHPTIGSGLLLARYSVFYALRSEFRKQVSLRMIPGLERLLGKFARYTGAAGAGTAATRSELLRKRADEIAELSRDYSVPIHLVIPPSGSSPLLALDEKAVLDAVARSGMQGILPLPSSDTQPDQFADGFHLNENGRAAFTSKLAQAILALP